MFRREGQQYSMPFLNFLKSKLRDRTGSLIVPDWLQFAAP